jgi:DNA-binding HxlR family transcriptional regulator
MAERKTTSTNFINQSFLETKCALNELIYLLSKRWMTEVLFSIEEGNNRFSSIKEDLQFISDHILADRLRVLEQNRFISKRSFHETHPRAEYSLTDLGRELSDQLGRLCEFAEELELHHSGEKRETAETPLRVS